MNNMFSARTASSDNIVRQIPSTPPATYLYNSAPSTPLPATLSTFKAQGINWSSSQELPHTSEFPWNLSSMTPKSPSSGLNDEDMFALAETSNYAHGNPRSPIAMQSQSSQSKSPLSLRARHSRKLSGGRKPSAKTTLRLHLPPVNQEALLEAARASNLIPDSVDDIASTDFGKSKQKLRLGLPANMIMDIEGNVSLNTSEGISESDKRKAPEPNVIGEGSTSGLKKSYQPPQTAKSIKHLHGLSGRMTLAMLTPPDESRDMNWQNFSSTWSEGGLRINRIDRENANTYRVLPSSSGIIGELPNSSISQVQNDGSPEIGETESRTTQLETMLDDRLDVTEHWLKDALKIMCKLSIFSATKYC